MRRSRAKLSGLERETDFAMPPAARIGDMHVCPIVVPGTPPIPHVGGPVLAGSPNVVIGSMPAARVGDQTICTGMGIPDPIAKGSATVMINGMPAARIGDLTSHGGSVVAGFPTVIIGDSSNGGGGAPGMARSGAGEAKKVSDVISPLISGHAMTAPDIQTKALKAAAKSGTPFCDVCR
jgi:uncharacterized Zn-binding protein involved in type VI secretion